MKKLIFLLLICVSLSSCVSSRYNHRITKYEFKEIRQKPKLHIYKHHGYKKYQDKTSYARKFKKNCLIP
jgi:hypothetical protein